MNTISTEVRMLANWLRSSQLGVGQGNEYHYSVFAESGRSLIGCVAAN